MESNTSTSCFDSISDMHTRRAHSQRKLLVLGTCNLTTYKFSFSSHASTCNLLKPEQLQQKIYYTSSRALADFPSGLPMLLVCTVTSHKCRWIWQLSPKCAPSILMDFIPVWSAARLEVPSGLAFAFGRAARSALCNSHSKGQALRKSFPENLQADLPTASHRHSTTQTS